MLEVIETLSEMLSGRVVVSEEELRRKALRAGIKSLGIGMKKFGEGDLKEVVLSFIDCPLSVRSAYFSEKISLKGITFYHLHTVKPQPFDFEIAFSEYIKSKAFLDNLEKLMIATDKFFEGYAKEGHFLRIYSSKSKFAVFFTTISDLREDAEIHLKLASNFEGEYVAIVQTEEKPTEFVEFFRLHSENFKRANAKVWVADPAGVVDPFIGYPKDPKLIKRFRNPKLASRINSLWREKVEELD
ncbi:MAG: hypothetical protein NZ879_03765 [Archaeoglobaceae archaeon]|nr:hypothetical protein [Archaeoglobaceae archaeon]MDW8118083.1 hypothetical protein [Archaeoglobaceae archaeon]